MDAIINTKPLERRVLFDEAAGISKYKARKEEALAKLARTDEDLVRLNDINRGRFGARRIPSSGRCKRPSAISDSPHAFELWKWSLLAGRYLRLRDTAQEVHAQYEELHAEVERSAELAGFARSGTRNDPRRIRANSAEP
ncbi:MAG: hypothetical protein KatS3mg130_0170 [Candidatus Sumerlaea sp.]|nr:MAG: hypothetical protein KatS3mg130_0170 [Candidatus Sumerlaea sp.]